MAEEITAAELITRVRVDGENEWTETMRRMDEVTRQHAASANSASAGLNSLGGGFGNAGGAAAGLTAQLGGGLNPALSEAVTGTTNTNSAMAGLGQQLSSTTGWMSMANAGTLALATAISTGLVIAFHEAEQAAMGAARAFISFTEDSVEEAAKIERLTLTFGALSHSMDEAREKMGFLRGYASHSLNTFDDIAEGAKIMEAGGLNSERFVGMMDRMGGLLHTGRQGVVEIAEAFARIGSGGNFGQAMRVFRGVGIGVNDLKAEGIDVSKGNHINATSEQMLGALESIFQKKFGELGSYLEKSMSVRFSNLQDAWNHLMDSFGQAWFPLITRIIDAVQPFIVFLTNSGEIQRIGESFANAFDSLFHVGNGEGIQRLLSYVVATIEYMPDIIKNVGTMIGNVLNAVGNAFIGTLNFMGAAMDSAINAAKDVLSPTLKALQGLGLFKGVDYQAFSEHVEPTPYKDMGDFLGRMLDVAAGKPIIANELPDRANQIFDDFMNYKPPPGDTSDPRNKPMFNPSHVDAPDDKLDKIEAHTAAISHNTASMQDWKRYALGGGDAAGISVAEIYGHIGSGNRLANSYGPGSLAPSLAGGGGGGGRGPVSIRVDAGSRKLNEALTDMFAEFMLQAHREGLLGGGEN